MDVVTGNVGELVGVFLVGTSIGGLVTLAWVMRRLAAQMDQK